MAHCSTQHPPILVMDWHFAYFLSSSHEHAIVDRHTCALTGVISTAIVKEEEGQKRLCGHAGLLFGGPVDIFSIVAGL